MKTDTLQTDYRQGWQITIYLTLLFIMSFVDRLILVVLAPSVSHDIGFVDSQMGFILGAGFAVIYSLSGFPVARRIDRGDRRRIVVAGVMLWSVMTIASAFAQGFWSLCVTRAGVAIGETVLTPAAISLIADMFSRERRVLPTSVFSSVGGFMGTGALIVGAVMLDIATRLSPHLGLAPWRITLILVGLPGIILALLFSRVREPPRVSVSDRTAIIDVGYAEFFRHLRQRMRFYLPFYVGLGFSSMISLGMVSWLPTYLVRHFAMTPSQAGYWLGSLGVPAGLAGAYGWPFFGRMIDRRFPGRGFVVALLVSLALVAAFVGSVAIPGSRSTLAPLFALAVFGTSGTAVLAGLVIQDVGPPPMRARLMAIVLLAFNLIGLGLGPSVVPLVAGWWTGDTTALAHGVSVLALGAGGLGVMCFAYCTTTVTQRLPKLVGRGSTKHKQRRS